MDNHPVSSIEIEYHNNDYGSTLSSCTQSKRAVVFTTNSNRQHKKIPEKPYVAKNPNR